MSFYPLTFEQLLQQLQKTIYSEREYYVSHSIELEKENDKLKQRIKELEKKYDSR